MNTIPNMNVIGQSLLYFGCYRHNRDWTKIAKVGFIPTFIWIGITSEQMELYQTIITD